MLPLPILNVRLQACSEDWLQMTPTTQGHHCAHCDRVVIDFTQATPADLAAAFQSSPDGRVCGRFQPEQLAVDQAAPLSARVALRPKLRRFLVALLLVCGLGLGAREAVAQVRQAVPPVPPPKSTPDYWASRPFGGVEQMALFKGGQEGLLRFLETNLHWPAEAPKTLNGRVFVKFQITETGAVRDVQLLRQLHPALDAEAVRVVKLMDGYFTPGYQNQQPIATTFTLPITFGEVKVAKQNRKRK
ncbi:hypothetical protein CDA63_04910 [Hymenobacter amundsenii]|uniref:TonB C-terminal domain-containing protein n=1 Tax=Hymenobacter amundsenii TaxID=2006685 RepID=A0A246FNM8_9BACT|nr:energy transducer TonB [Hymenobacter amundsenii]OWP64376.1 hypothetical protein CDA63_04910 [Hymenobacter amundsenii]